MKNMIVASTSTLHGSGYLEYLQGTLEELFQSTDSILFIPYARPGGISHDDYTQIASKSFQKIGKELIGIHSFKDPVEALHQATGIFTGGGNTFVLVSQLYHFGVMAPLRELLFEGIPYLGSSAGSNICGLSMQTTNDMPIVYPPSFKTLGVLPFNLNPHFIDADPHSTHMGETRETRIKEFHTQNSIPVLGLREGSWLAVKGEEIKLEGVLNARSFEPGKNPMEIPSGAKIKYH